MSEKHSCILSVDAGGTYLKAALIDTKGNIVPGSFIKVPVNSEDSAEDIKSSYVRLARQGIETADRLKKHIKGIGVSIPGPFDYDEGLSRMKHKYASIYGIPIRPWLEQGAGVVPIKFIHDSTAFILGATWNERYSDFRRIAAVIIGTGLGFACMFDSKVYNNPQGGPGISIFRLPYKGKTADDYVSRRAIIRRYKELLSVAADSIDVIDISILAHDGQTEAIRVFKEIGVHLSKILYNIICDNAFECLLLGGAISKSGDLFIPALKGGLSGIKTLSVIEQAANIDETPLLGAARAMLRQEGAIQ